MSIRTFALATAATVSLLAAAPMASAAEGALTADQRAEVETIVKDYVTANPGFIRDYLMANPEVIRDAIDALQSRQQEEERAAQIAAIDQHRDLLFSSPRQVVKGNPDGDVTLIEFFDYNCGYCRRAVADMDRLIEADPNLRVVLKEFPVLGEGSVQASQVSVAVRIVAPEKADAFHSALITQSGQVNAEVALTVAEALGIDRARLEEAMQSDEVRETITEVYMLAEALSLTGTPSYVTATDVAIGAIGYDALQASIADARANCTSATC